MELPRSQTSLFNALDRPATAWRVFLCVLFGLALLVRFLVYLDVADRPLGQFDRWPGSEGWFLGLKAMETVERESWLMPGPNLIMRPEMMAAGSAEQWTLWAGMRLPRGALVHYLAVVSHALGGGLVLYSMVALLAGSLLPVLIAIAGARLFRDKRAGVVAGLVASSHHTLVVGSVFPGPWMWEALVFVAILVQVLRLPDVRANPAEWALLSILVGVGLWLRPLFGWGVVLMGGMMLALRPGNVGPVLLAVLLPVAFFAGALSTRNVMVGASLIPSVGQPAWDFFETTNPEARFRTEVPRDMILMDASRGSFPRLVRIAMGQRDFRDGLGSVLGRKIRELAGGRDVADSLSPAYIRLRLETLRLTTLAPLAAMALAWGSLIFLVYRRRLPLALALALGVVVLHGLLFRTDGMERTLLHACGCLLAGGALALAAGDLRCARPGHAFLLLVFWAIFNYGLLIDDHSRGTRFRSWDFAQAQRIHLERGERLHARGEEKQFREIRRQELLTMNFWNLI